MRSAPARTADSWSQKLWQLTPWRSWVSGAGWHRWKRWGCSSNVPVRSRLFTIRERVMADSAQNGFWSRAIRNRYCARAASLANQRQTERKTYRHWEFSCAIGFHLVRAAGSDGPWRRCIESVTQPWQENTTGRAIWRKTWNAPPAPRLSGHVSVLPMESSLLSSAYPS